MGYAVIAALAIGLAVLFLVEAEGYPDAASRFPSLLAYIVIGLALLMVAETAAKSFTAGKREVRAPVDRRRVILMGSFALAVIAYVALLETLGYLITTVVLLLGCLLGYRAVGPVHAFAITAGVTAAIYGVFIYFLRLPIPLLPSW